MNLPRLKRSKYLRDVRGEVWRIPINRCHDDDCTLGSLGCCASPEAASWFAVLVPSQWSTLTRS